MNVSIVILLASVIPAQPATAEKAWKESMEETAKYYRQGDYRGADRSVQRASMYARRLEEADSRRAETLIECARIKWKLGRYQTALDRLDEAEAALAKASAKQPVLAARAWNLRAELLTAIGRHHEATKLAEKAYQARFKMNGAENLETLESMDTKAYLDFGDGWKSLEIREKMKGEGHPELAPAYLLIARIRAYTENAGKHARTAMRLFQKIDPDHAELADAWTQLGRHQRIRGEFDEAEQTLEHALKHWNRLEADHPRGAEALAELAMVRGHQHKPEEADKLFREALERHFSDLSDDDLCGHFAKLPSFSDFRWPDGGPRVNNVEAYLAEMSRRGGPVIEKALQKHAMELTKKRQAWKPGGFGERDDPLPRNLELLTAARRLLKKDDPVAIEVKGPHEIEAIFPHIPHLSVALVNQDEKRLGVGYQVGGDYRGGRQERWRLDVRDAKGKHVPVVPRLSSEGGGFTGYGILKPGKNWHTLLEVRNFVELLPGDYTIRVQYHDSDEIAALDWLAGRIVCQSPEILLHIQPRVIDLTAKEKQEIAKLLEKLDEKGEIKVLAGSYGKGAHKFIPPDSTPGKILGMGWKAVPQMIDESLNDVTPPQQRAWMLALLFSITTYHSPTAEEGILPTYTYASPGWSVRFGTDEQMSSGGAGWSEPHRAGKAKIVLSKQLEFARRWEDFRKYIVIRDDK